MAAGQDEAGDFEEEVPKGRGGGAGIDIVGVDDDNSEILGIEEREGLVEGGRSKDVPQFVGEFEQKFALFGLGIDD
jgi:hypothetical protein